jgi:hypothetical protein
MSHVSCRMSTSSCRSRLAFLAVDVNVAPEAVDIFLWRTSNHSVHTLPRSRQDRRSRGSGAEHVNDNELAEEVGAEKDIFSHVLRML